ncbi:class I SAM-dependent methyltransferase [Candidatus Sumerlaeota bacterium]|nr:class I SAM-dependent methyltransferase [Candidatus Sumerlaeota bacterium]
MRLLDLCCGPGRHLGQLVPLLGSAVGIDLSRALLSQARDSCRANLAENFAGGDHRFHLVEGDMRHLPFAEGLFDIVINLFTSFGYFEPEEENLAVLEEIVRVLHPSGVFVLDHINRSHLETFLEADSERRLRNGARVFERRRFDPGRRRIIKHVEWVDPGGGRIRWDESVRVYDEQELAAVFLRVGFGSLIKFGDYDGSPLQSDSARMIIIARRGAAA